MGSGFRTFASGEVLTSSNVQNYLMDQSVMVFAGTAARSSAIGSAETGMLTYRTDGTADAARQGFEFWNGSAWTRLVKPIGLELITTVTASATSTININNCFTSTYKNYKLVSNLTTSANTGVAMRLRVGGTDNTTSNYGISYRYNLLTGSNVGDATSTGQTQFNLHISNLCRAINMNMTLFNPQVADYTTGAFSNSQAENAAVDFYSFRGGLEFKDTTQFDGFSIYTGGAPTITGKISIYGIREE